MKGEHMLAEKSAIPPGANKRHSETLLAVA